MPTLRQLVDLERRRPRIDVVLRHEGRTLPRRSEDVKENIVYRPQIRDGDVLAVIVRDFDGARGRHVLAHAGLDQTKFKEREAKMAHPGMISSLTTGSTQTNDVFRLLYGTTEYDEVPTNVEIVQLAREALRLGGVDGSKIFAEPETDKLFCQQRLHAFPLRDPARGLREDAERSTGEHAQNIGLRQHAAGPVHAGMSAEERAKYVHAERKPEEAEGGRLHPHTDRAGTDAVVLLNMGCCEFTFDLPNKCKAQQSKEAWCIDNGGHWAQQKDCQYWPLGEDKPSDKEAWRYGLGQYMAEPLHSLLRNRQCSACATARDESELGEPCARCVENTHVLYSGDLIIFNGKEVVHGLTRVLKEPPVEPRPGAPPLPPLPSWAADLLGRHFRVSLQYRLMNQAKFKADLERDKAEYVQHLPGAKRPREDAVGLGPWAGTAQSSARSVDERNAQQLAAGIAASLRGGAPTSQVFDLTSDDDEPPAASPASRVPVAATEATVVAARGVTPPPCLRQLAERAVFARNWPGSAKPIRDERRVLEIGPTYYTGSIKGQLAEVSMAADDPLLPSLWAWAHEQGLGDYNAAMVLVYDDLSSNIDWHFDKVEVQGQHTKLAGGSRVHSFSFAKHPADEGKLLAVMEFGTALGKNPNDKATFFPSAADETVPLYHGTHVSFDPYAAATKGFGGRHPHGGRKHRVKETLAGGGRINLTFRRIVDRTTDLPA